MFTHFSSMVGLFAALSAPLQTAPTPGQSPPASDRLPQIGPAVYTLPEIARQMEIPGRKITCDSRLMNRAAYLFLKPRPYAQDCRLLSEALGIRFIQTQPGDWRMEPEPDILAREQRWQEAYLALFRRKIDSAVAHWNQKYRQKTREEWRKVHARNQREMEQMDEQQTNPDFDPETYFQMYLLVENALSETRDLLSMAGWAVTEVLRGDWAAHTLLTRGFLVQTGDLSALTENGLTVKDLMKDWKDLPFFQRELNQVEKVFDTTVYGVPYAPGEGTLTALWSLTGIKSLRPPNNETEGEILTPTLTQSLPTARLFGNSSLTAPFETPSTLFPQFGDAAEAWLKNEQAATEASLRSDRAALVFLDKPTPESLTLSQAVERWSRQYRQEAIMELFPERETAYWNTEAGQAELVSVAGKGITLRRLFGRGTGEEWSLHDQEGVLRVTNRLAFLDRLHTFPMAAFVALERQIPPGVDESGRPVLPYEAVAAYCRAVTPEENAAWSLFAARAGLGYRGLPLYDISLVQPFLRLVDSLPLQERTGVWRTLREKTQPPPFEAGRFENPVLRQMQATLLAFGIETVLFRHPAFWNRMRHWNLSLHFEEEEDKPGVGTLTFQWKGQGVPQERSSPALYRVRLPR